MADSGSPFPDLPSSQVQASSKPKRPPTITPKRFTRFFNPRQDVAGKSKHSTRSSRQLRDITKNGINRKLRSPKDVAGKVDADDSENLTPRRSKRRKLTPIPDSSPLQLQSSPCKGRGGFQPIDLFEDMASIDGMDRLCDDFARLPTPVRRLRPSNASRIMQRSFGGSSTLQRGYARDPCADWRHSTGNFYSSAEDVCPFGTQNLPFSVAPCNSNPLVALADESGYITIVDTASDPDISFAKPHVKFRPHHNAIMDLTFSSDDFLIATASGDQTARVVDMRTQQTRYIMTGHVSSVKTIRFQPGNDSVLATSSRDGSVQLWDLRCRGSDAPPDEPTISRSSTKTFPTNTASRQVVYADTCISLRDAHASAAPPLPRRSSADLFSTRSSTPQTRGEVSITALSFLPGSRSHLLISASEANSTLKLWDIRGKYNRRGPAVPLSSTIEPASHSGRRYGIASLALSTNGGRLYALCRDSTVYAYSTNHLALGHAPELDSRKKDKWRGYGVEKEGLAPLYGLRHASLKASSFYIKASVRKAGPGREEMLAVGSRDGCAVVMPTDEGHFRRREREDDDVPSLSGTPIKKGKEDGMEMYEVGTALVRGHNKEVTGLGWTSEGALVTMSDDYTSRVWREGEKARELRMGGEGEGQRWGCGWADVEADFDEEDV